MSPPSRSSATSSASPAPDRAAGRRFDWGQPFVYLVALVVVAVAIGPVLYVFIGGFRTTADLNANPAGMPDPWTFAELGDRARARPRFWGNVLASIDPRRRRRRPAS